MAGTHGYAMGYIVIEVENDENQDIFDEKRFQTEQPGHVR
jgi:hypothetical protein